ncbi:MAG: maltose/glucose-specific PTS transporter subunit IIBC [Aerococcaceae bacterium]|nr:maltose/glucose-specific PTS transporter subunit IIBC [Aerococcaceae bacterium]
MSEKSKSLRVRFFSFFQELGKTFMFPVALLAFLGMLLGLGSSIASDPVIERFPFLGHPWIQLFFQYLTMVGSLAFRYLPAMFAMAIPLGLSKRNKGVGVFAGFVGFIAMHMSINFYLQVNNQLAPADALRLNGQGMVLGIQSIEMGVLGGIIAGLIVYFLHEKFQDTVLPDAFSFFGGIRFVPIISSLVMAVVGLVIPIIWPVFSSVITAIGHVIAKAGVFGPFIYGLGTAVLKPFGMHHILLAMVRFTDVGGTQVVNGETVSGALNIFYSQLNAGEPISPQATAFLSQGFMPTFMFGLPAIAFAIYMVAKKENRPAIKGLLMSGFLVAFVTGISEPIEFLFLFIAPALYVFHSIMSGLSLMVMAMLGVVIGNTDGGVIDWVIFGMLQGNYTKWYLLIPVGIVWFAIYYFVFKWYITKYDIATPGRKDEPQSEENGEIKVFTKGNGIYDPAIILQALGGKENITHLDNCVTRLRLQVKDAALIDKNTLRKAGALGVVELDAHNVQVIIGAQVQTVKTGIEQLM